MNRTRTGSETLTEFRGCPKSRQGGSVCGAGWAMRSRQGRAEIFPEVGSPADYGRVCAWGVARTRPGCRGVGGGWGGKLANFERPLLTEADARSKQPNSRCRPKAAYKQNLILIASKGQLQTHPGCLAVSYICKDLQPNTGRPFIAVD